MCKVAAVMQIKESNRKKVWNFMKKLGEEMTHYNNDGLGYAAVDLKDKIFGEKWLDNGAAFGKSHINHNLPTAGPYAYDSFGEVNREEAKSIILHTRMATCSIGIDNTHPFVDDLENPTKALIHNGVIYNHASFLKKYSTCDSEALLTSYIEEQVAEDSENIKHLFEAIEGWFVVFNFTTIEDKVYLDLFTNVDRLVSSYVDELGTTVFSTSQTDIINTCKHFGYTFKNMKHYPSDKFWRFNINTGEVVKKIDTYSPDTKIEKTAYDIDYWEDLIEMLMSREDV